MSKAKKKKDCDCFQCTRLDWTIGQKYWCKINGNKPRNIVTRFNFCKDFRKTKKERI